MVETLLPSENTVSDRNSAFLAELTAFNAEAIAISAEIEAIRPQSQAFYDLGLKLEKVVEAGLQNLAPSQLARFNAGFAEMVEFRRHYEPRYNALVARISAQERREKDLKRRAKQLNAAVDFHSLAAIGNN